MNPETLRSCIRVNVLDLPPDLLELASAFSWGLLKASPTRRIRGEHALKVLDRQEEIVSTVYGIKSLRDLDHIAAVVHAFAGGAS